MPSGAAFDVTGPNGYSASVLYSAFTGGSYTLTELAPGSYTVEERGAGVPGYRLTTVYLVDGEPAQSVIVAIGATSRLTVSNEYARGETPPPTGEGNAALTYALITLASASALAAALLLRRRRSAR